MFLISVRIYRIFLLKCPPRILGGIMWRLERNLQLKIIRYDVVLHLVCLYHLIIFTLNSMYGGYGEESKASKSTHGPPRRGDCALTIRVLSYATFPNVWQKFKELHKPMWLALLNMSRKYSWHGPEQCWIISIEEATKQQLI